jgi:hypothetical protein
VPPPLREREVSAAAAERKRKESAAAAEREREESRNKIVPSHRHG